MNIKELEDIYDKELKSVTQRIKLKDDDGSNFELNGKEYIILNARFIEAQKEAVINVFKFIISQYALREENVKDA